MRIYRGEPVDGFIAEEVKIGDPLTLVVTIDDQDIYGMQVTECVVKDGLGWSEQALINSDGYGNDRDSCSTQSCTWACCVEPSP